MKKEEAVIVTLGDKKVKFGKVMVHGKYIVEHYAEHTGRWERLYGGMSHFKAQKLFCQLVERLSPPEIGLRVKLVHPK